LDTNRVRFIAFPSVLPECDITAVIYHFQLKGDMTFQQVFTGYGRGVDGSERDEGATEVQKLFDKISKEAKTICSLRNTRNRQVLVVY
jgi:hypothetical protein